jgi:membrane associated rhomboid family serine protease
MSITIFIVAGISIVSLIGFSNREIIDRLLMWPYRMWRDNEWYRLISCAFIHGDLGHLFFNMFAMFSFGSFIEQVFGGMFPGYGTTMYMIMFFTAVAVANIVNVFQEKDNYAYRSLGASGGVAAIIFAYILITPKGGISIYFLPSIPAYIFGPLYLIYSAVMAKRANDNVGHTAHFTGAVYGFIFPLIFKPRLLLDFFDQIRGY